MTSTLAADSKLMFYPTDLKEVYRIFYLLCASSLKYYAPFNEQPQWSRIRAASDNRYVSELIDRILCGETNATLSDFFYLRGSSTSSFTVMDPFAGDGTWLNSVKSDFSYAFKPYTVAIEIEKDRFDSIDADFKLNAAFEELRLPPKSVSVLLYNPPYGFTNKIRNVRHYLQLILDGDILLDDAVLACVIREDDAYGISDLLFSHFELKTHYRVNEAEYAKYKQCVLILTKRDDPVNLDTMAGADGLTLFRDQLTKTIESGVGFESTVKPEISIPTIKSSWEQLYLKHSARVDRDGKFSPIDRVWKWVCDDSRARLSENFNLTMPKSPKISEIANLLASGIINGHIDDPDAPHVVSGGVRSVKRRETTLTENSKGDEVEVIKEVRFSQPYLNVLVVKNGKIEVKNIEAAQ